jgi:hypothetical protein
MTNNPTIDGVSRELLTNLLHCGNSSSFIPLGITKQLRALLDAPVGERVPAPGKTNTMAHMGCDRCGCSTVEHCDEIGCGYLGAGNGEPGTESYQVARECQSLNFDPDAISAGPGGVTEAERLQATCDGLDSQNDALADEVAALQSTIAQLQAESARIKAHLCVCRDCGGQGEVYSGHSSYQGHNQPPEPDMDVCGTCDGDGVLGPIEDFEALASERDLLQARIAELESGRGEADAWALLNGGGLIRDLTDRWDVAKDWDGIVEPLYFAPPAPVAVVLPERKPDINRSFEGTDAEWYGNIGWNDCLDAAAALNGVNP